MIEIKPVEAKTDSSGFYSPDQRFPGTVYYHAVPMNEANKFITGLDEYSPSIQTILDPKERAKAVAAVTAKRKRLEALTGLILDQDTPEGREYFEDKLIDLANIDTLNPNNPYDAIDIAILYENMKNPDFPVAFSKDLLDSDPSGKKEFYIVNEERELEESISITKLRGRAMAALTELEETDLDKMRMIARIVLPQSIPINSTTSRNYIYKKLTEFLDLSLFPTGEKTYESVCREFLEQVKKSKSELDLLYTVNQAIHYNIISKHFETNKYYNRASGFVYGPRIEDILSKLADPMNIEELGTGKETDRSDSIKYQIKQKESLK